MYRVERGGSYIRFANSDNKVWIVPRKGIHTALCIYQPSGVKGRVAKGLLPYIYRMPLLSRLFKVERVNVVINNSLKRLICEVLKIDNFEFSIFEGTPSVHKKVTIQIFQGSNILGYCKVSDNPEIVDLFRSEQEHLNYIHQRGITGAPTCYYCGDVDDESDYTAYIISTTKTLKSHYPHSWSHIHQEFIEEVHDKTKCKILFADSDFARSLSTLEGYLPILPSRDAALLTQAIGQVRGYYGDGEVEFSAYHGDFTPWNMFVEKGELFVFDGEYSSLTYPPYLDFLHFFTQVCLLERGLSTEQIVKLIDKKIVESYKAYLLAIVSRYIDREHGVLTPDTKEMLKIWLDILREL